MIDAIQFRNFLKTKAEYSEAEDVYFIVVDQSYDSYAESLAKELGADIDDIKTCFTACNALGMTCVYTAGDNLSCTIEVSDKTVISVELNDDDQLDDENFRVFRSTVNKLTEGQCRLAMRQLILGQSTESAEMAMFARIADYLAFGAKYSGMEREAAVEAFKATLTVDNLREAWDKCGF